MSDHEHPRQGEPENKDVTFETVDAAPKPIVLFGVGLFILSVLSFFLMWLMYEAMRHVETAGNTPRFEVKDDRWNAPGITLEANSSSQRRAYEAEQKQMVTTYGWVDPQNHIARIPVAKAMEISLKKGFPVRAAMPAENDLFVPSESGGAAIRKQELPNG